MLELEQALQDERIKLGALRKKHYDLAKDEEEEVEVFCCYFNYKIANILNKTCTKMKLIKLLFKNMFDALTF